MKKEDYFHKYRNWYAVFLSEKLPVNWLDKLVGTGQKFFLSPEFKNKSVPWHSFEADFFRCMLSYDSAVSINVPFEILKSVFGLDSDGSIHGVVFQEACGVGNKYGLLYNFIFDPYTLKDLRSFNGADKLLPYDELAAKFKEYDENIAAQKAANKVKQTNADDFFATINFPDGFETATSSEQMAFMRNRQKVRCELILEKLCTKETNVKQLDVKQIVELIYKICNVHYDVLKSMAETSNTKCESAKKLCVQLENEISLLDERIAQINSQINILDNMTVCSWAEDDVLAEMARLSESLRKSGDKCDLTFVLSYYDQQHQFVKKRKQLDFERYNLIEKRDKLMAELEQMKTGMNELLAENHEIYGGLGYIYYLSVDIDSLTNIFNQD